jgi:hypothetical protein
MVTSGQHMQFEQHDDSEWWISKNMDGKFVTQSNVLSQLLHKRQQETMENLDPISQPILRLPA